MVKKSTMVFAILAMLAFGACYVLGYTVTQWPVPGIPNTTFGPGAAALSRPRRLRRIMAHMADPLVRRIWLPGELRRYYTAVMAQVTMGRAAGAGSLLSSGAGGVSWLIWSCEKVPKGLPDNGHGCSSD